MKKIFTSFLCAVIFSTSFAQWNPTTMHGEKLKPSSDAKSYYSLDIQQIRNALKNAEETGKGAKPVIIIMPTLEGKIEKFAVYSFPVLVKSLADRYQLGSYVGVGVDDPTKYVRFSVAPNDFQSMISSNGKYQFIEPQNADKSVYGIHAKTINTGDKPFLCNTTELGITKAQMDKLFKDGDSFTNQPTNFAKSSDKKYRTMRLAISVTGEYTTFFGGVPGAMAQINATMTRVNGVFENDFSLHLNVQDFPNLIYTDANTDPYSPGATGSAGNWNVELMNTLHASPGDAAFDIGHLFGASDGGGNAGCIGCVCNNTLSTGGGANQSYKGSGFTSPGDSKPFGDNFDIDYVAHEMGHQLGGNHTFAYKLESSGVNMEPGSGSTIMGYAGITGATNDVAPHSDPFFHIASIIQIQANLATKTCAVVTAIPNNPPVIAALPNVTIPKATAFVLTASATDAESDPLTYSWEEYDNATSIVNNTNLGTTNTGASFRSLIPTANPTRYFPKLATVLSGAVKNIAEWESTSTIARSSKYRVTVRDNSTSSPGYQQTQSAQQVVTVGDDGPFVVSSTKVFNNATGPINWDIVNTDKTPYNVANVKIDYTVDNGSTWTVVSASTPNTGSANVNFAPLATGSLAKVRISAIGNVFYAVKQVTVAQLAPCDGSAPTNVVSNNITNSEAKISWDPLASATYVVRYRKIGDATWTSISTNDNFVNLTNLDEGQSYEIQVASVCSGTTGTYSASTNFSTLSFTYCALASGSSNYEYISNVKVTSEGGTVVTNTSGASTYTSYAADPTKLINLKANTTNNIIEVTKAWVGNKFNESIYIWIDFNRDGVYDASELVAATPNNQSTPISITFPVPADAYVGDKTVGMRIILSDSGTQATACSIVKYGEVEDYSVKISPFLAISESGKTQAIQVYPNPAVDVLNITKVSNNATYSIYNVAGQIIAKGNIANNKVSVSKLEKGVYIISVDNNGETAKVKFIKK